MDKIIHKLREIREEFAGNQLLDAEVRDSVVDLVDEVMADLTPDNLKALAIALKAVADGEKYVAALKTIIDDLPESYKYVQALDELVTDEG